MSKVLGVRLLSHTELVFEGRLSIAGGKTLVQSFPAPVSSLGSAGSQGIFPIAVSSSQL
jgi:hypothetical protein